MSLAINWICLPIVNIIELEIIHLLHSVSSAMYYNLSFIAENNNRDDAQMEAFNEEFLNNFHYFIKKMFLD